MKQAMKKGISALLVLAMTAGSFATVGPAAGAADTPSESYRNLALRRAAYHSSAADYDQTGHLATDGIVPETTPDSAVFSDQYGNSPEAESPAQAFDKQKSTKWLTTDHQQVWLQVAFPSTEAYTAKSYSITTANDQPRRDPRRWVVQGSNDGINFDDLDTREDITWTKRFQTQKFDMVNDTSYQYYRLNILENSNPDFSTIQLAEFDLFDDTGASIIKAPPFHSYWESKNAGEQYVYVDLGTESTFDKVVIDWNGENYATSYEIQVSDDSENWESIVAAEDGIGGKEEVAFDTAAGRYVRLLCKTANASTYMVNELQVYGTNDLSYHVDAMPEPEADGIQYLRGGNWRLERASQVQAGGVALSSAEYDDSTWLPATVPGTVLTSYLKAGAIADPNYDDQQLQISDSYFTTNWWYRNSFEIPKSQEGRKVWLNFNSINWKADVYFNGENVGEIEGAFIRSKFDVTDLVKFGEENDLAVYIHMNDNPGDVTEQTLLSNGPNGGILGKDNPTIHASIGWDWVPTIRGRDIGIYDDVFLSYTEDLQIRYPWVKTDLDLGGPQTLTVENLAKGAAATASSNDKDNGIDVPPSNAVDGSDKTRWASLWNDNEWIMLDFGDEITFSATQIKWEAAYAKSYQLEASNDGTNWETVQTVTDCKGGTERRFFDEVTARYLRLTGVTRATKFGISMWEFEVYHATEADFADRDPDFSKADLTACAEVTNTKAEAVTAKLSGTIQPGNVVFEKEVELAAGATEEVVIDGIVLNDPELWWPNTYGDQFLYTCNMKVSMGNQISDEKSFKFAVREFTYSEGGPLIISCNGTRIVCRGGNWGMDDSNLAATAEDYDIKVRLHAEENFNMIRNWVGMTGNEAFYDACDKYGMLVFDDFWLANPADGPEPDDEAMFMANAVDKIKRVRGRASLCFYCGRNEGSPLPSLNTALKEATVELDGTHHYTPDSASGELSGRGPYEVKDPKYYFNNAPTTLHTERGMLNIPSLESIQAMLSEKNQWPINNVWGLHDYSNSDAQGNNSFTNAMKKYSSFNSVEEFARIAQMVNYENHKALFEATLNKRGNGMLMWMSQSAWPSFIWQTYDYFYDTNAGYFGIKTANQPVNAIWDCTNNNIVLTNNTPKDYEDVTVITQLYDLNGIKLTENRDICTVSSDQNVTARTLAYPEGATDITFIKTRVEDADGNKIAENFYWTNRKTYQDYAALSALDTIDVKADCEVLPAEGSTRFYRVKVSNPSDTPALMIRIKTTNDRTAERVLPVYYEDNYFSLMPGDEKEITLEFDEKYLNGGNPIFAVEGWNVKDAIMNQPGDISVARVTLDRTEAALTVGNTVTLKATLEPEDATNQNVTWATDKPLVATVDANGVVKAVSVGTAVITVTTEDGGKTAACKVTVAENAAYSIEIAADKTSVQADGDVAVTVTVKGGAFVGAACKMGYENDKFEVKSAPDGWTAIGENCYAYYNVIDEGFYPEDTVLGAFVFTAKDQPKEVTASFTLSDTYLADQWEDGWSTDDAEQVPNNGSVTVTITPTPAYVVEIVNDYVAGYSLVLVYTDNKTGAYAYDGEPMYDVTDAGYLYQGTKYTHVYGLVVKDASAGKVASAEKSAGTLTYSTDVNGSNTTDLNDAVAVVAVYNSNELYMSAIHMDIVLKADVSGNKKVDVDDFGLIKAEYM